MADHNIAQIIHQSPEPEGGYVALSPVKVIYQDGKEASSQWGSDVGGGGVLAWRAENGDEAAVAYTAPPTPVPSVISDRQFAHAL